MNTAQSNHSVRWHGLDELRALATVCVVLLHAAVPYLDPPMPGLLWLVYDSAHHRFVDGLFWGIEGCIMPVFFLMSGFFAATLIHRRGLRAFIRHRRKRILLPLILAACTILPMELYIWGYGLVQSGRAEWRSLRTLKFEPEISEQLWGLSHLWYLQYLMLYSLAFAAGWGLIRLVRRTHGGNRIAGCIAQRIPTGQWGWWVLASVVWMAVFGVLQFWPEIVTEFQHSFQPVGPKFLHGSIFFLAGTGLYVLKDSLANVRRWGWFCLFGASVVFASMWTAITRFLESGGVEPSSSRLAFWLTTFVVLMTLGLFVAFGSIRRPTPRPLRYVAEASFWIYLIHHPIVAVCHLILAKTPLSASWKYAIAGSVTTALSLISYHLIVRNGRLGILLNGRRDDRSTVPAGHDSQSKDRSRAA